MLKYVMNFVTLLALLLAAACASQPNEISVNLGQKFNLAIGRSASISEEGLKIQFTEVISDSRCPRGALCVWEGEVSCLVEITYLESLHRKVLTQPGLTEGPYRSDFEEYEITFEVQPYPELGKQIKSEDYQLELAIRKKPAK